MIPSCIFGIWRYIKCCCDVYCVYGGVRCITGRYHLTLAESLFMVSFMYTVAPYSSVEYWGLQLELCYWSVWHVTEVLTQCPWYFTLSWCTNEWDVPATLENPPTETVTGGDRLREFPLYKNVFSAIATKLAFFPFIHSYCWCYQSLMLFKHISPLPVSAAQQFTCVLFSLYRENLNQIISVCAPSIVRHNQVVNSHETNEWMSTGVFCYSWQK